VPNSQGANEYNLIGQYRDGLSIYEYVRSNPIAKNDPTGLSLKSEAINKLKKTGDKHAGYDYYTKLTGLQSLIDDKLIPALEWLDDNDYFVGENRYYPQPRRDLYLSLDAKTRDVFHEAIHVYIDQTFTPLSSRTEEGIAYTATYMETGCDWIRLVEMELKKDVLQIQLIERRWKMAWEKINEIRGKPGQKQIKYQGYALLWKWTNVEDKDVINVASHLKFRIRCEKIAEHYNKILKAHPDWRKAQCPQFTCETETIPFVNVKRFHLNVELHSVFK